MMLTVAGFATGLLVGMTGVGGGALMTPVLLLVFGVPPYTAVGTDLWFAAVTKTAAMGVHHLAGLIDWQIARRLWLGSLPAAVLVLLVIKADLVSVPDSFLKSVIGLAGLLTAISMLFQKNLRAIGKQLRPTSTRRLVAIQPPLTVLAGSFLGALVTLTSIGAGALGAVVLMNLYPLRLNPSRLIATDIVHAIPLAIVAGLGHFVIGNVDFSLMGQLLLGSVPGVLLGALLSSRLPQAFLRGLLAIVLAAVSLRLWWAV